MIPFSRSLKFACLSAALVLGACTHKQEAVNTAPPPAPPPAAQPAPAPVTSRVVPGSAEDFRVNVGDTVHFAFDQYNVEDSDKSILGRQAAWLQKYPAVRVSVERWGGEGNVSIDVRECCGGNNVRLRGIGSDHAASGLRAAILGLRVESERGDIREYSAAAEGGV